MEHTTFTLFTLTAMIKPTISSLSIDYSRVLGNALLRNSLFSSKLNVSCSVLNIPCTQPRAGSLNDVALYVHISRLITTETETLHKILIKCYSDGVFSYKFLLCSVKIKSLTK